MGALSPSDLDLQDRLEAEFCPPLDTTLVAAFLADHLASSGAEPAGPALHELRELLGNLAASAAADQDALAGDLADPRIPAQSATTTEDSRDADADSMFDLCSGEASSSSGSSASPPEHGSPAQLDSALAFLRAAFPHLSAAKLKERLELEDLAGGLDMELVVEELLTDDYVKELQERGLEGDPDEAIAEETEKWHTVARKSQRQKSSTAVQGVLLSAGKKKKKPKGQTIAINDVRQKQHVRPHPQAGGARSAGDLWNQIVSISSYLETLLPRRSAFFQSYFHRPEYTAPANALRAALAVIANDTQSKSQSGSDSDSDPDHTPALLTLLEILFASPENEFDFDNEARAQLCEDAELALAATGGQPDGALDVVRLLQELEADKERDQEMGVYHQPASPLSSTASSTCIAPKSTLPLLPLPPPTSAPFLRPPPAPNQARKQDAHAWQQVRPARPKPAAVHPLAASIPAYDPLNVPRRKARGAVASAVPSGNAAHSRDYRGRIDACRARRDEALRTASRHWAGGSARTRGGEVALFYALEAQRHQAEARRLQLDAARELVERKRRAGSNEDTIDLHYCTAAEALALVREVLGEGWASGARPLRLVTGRGAHSAGGVAVLAPVLRNALAREGWNVGQWEAGLVVRGRAR